MSSWTFGSVALRASPACRAAAAAGLALAGARRAVVVFGFAAAFVAGFRFVADRALVAAFRVADAWRPSRPLQWSRPGGVDADVAARAAFAVELARRDVVVVADLAALATRVAVDVTPVFAAAALAVAARRRPDGFRAVDFVADADERRAVDAFDR